MNGSSTDGDRRDPASGGDSITSRLGVGGDNRSFITPPRLVAALLAVSTLVLLAQPAFADTSVQQEVRLASVERPLNPTTALSAPQPLRPERLVDPAEEVRKLSRALEVQEARKERERRAAEAKRKREAAARAAAARPSFVKPTTGRLTSGFGARWGTHHNGIDIANSIGTPIVSVAAGTVEEAGPASGFGLWVKIRHDDGTVTVYGHMYEYSVSAGQRVRAGQQIATIGNNGQSTGPHLHFEVWQGGGTKIDPLSWLAAKGVRV